MKICPNCNCENEDKSKFCKKCGTSLYKMYLRGTMNGWYLSEMSKLNTNADLIWFIEVELENQNYEFKFYNSNDEWFGGSYGENFTINLEAGKYRFEFNETKSSINIYKICFRFN